MSRFPEAVPPDRGHPQWLPPMDSPSYHAMLILFSLFVLGPIGAVVGTFMLFRLGFSIGGQVLAGLLGSAVTVGYGPEGKHGANYMQTAAASVASIGSLAAIIQTAVWLNLPPTPSIILAIYIGSIGMYGIGIGMLYTELVVDRMQLTFPSGLAVANILRALTDRLLLRKSISKLGSGAATGFTLGVLSGKLGSLGNLGLSVSTIGAGMVVGARVALPGFIVAVVGAELVPWLVSLGWLEDGQPFRKIGFVIGLGMILGAAALDIALILYEAVVRFRRGDVQPAQPDWKRTNKVRLFAWIGFWGCVVFYIGHFVLLLPTAPLLLCLGLTWIFLLVNGISTGIADNNPVSAAFVTSVFLMAVVTGLTQAGVGLMCGAILLGSCSVGVDMQQDRSTGARLNTNRVIQFRYQVIGVTVGAFLCVALAKLFMTAYPVLSVNLYGLEESQVPEEAKQWSSAFTYKFVGILQGLTHPNPNFTTALTVGLVIGFSTLLLRKLIKSRPTYESFVANSQLGFGTDFLVDSVFLPSPYASSFGGFVDILTALWFALGGILSSFAKFIQSEGKPVVQEEAGEEEMSTISLIGGGLIAGDSLAALALAVWALFWMFV